MVHSLPDDYWNRYADKVKQVTADDVKRFSDAYLDPTKLTVVMVATPETVKAQLQDLPLGPIEVRAAPASARPAAQEPAPAAPAPPAAKTPPKAASKKAAGGKK